MSWEDIVKKRKPWNIYKGLHIDGKWLKTNYPELEYVSIEVKHIVPNRKIPISVKRLSESHPEILEAWKDHRDKEDEKEGLEIRERNAQWVDEGSD